MRKIGLTEVDQKSTARFDSHRQKNLKRTNQTKIKMRKNNKINYILKVINSHNNKICYLLHFAPEKLNNLLEEEQSQIIILSKLI